MASFTGEHTVEESWLRATEDGNLPEVAAHDSQFAAILALSDFERFVYVLTVLEGWTDRECATLLHVSPPLIEEARLHALQHFFKR
jgi:DNA-directed RNA polymerase specialized sigma24 family protein